MRSTSVRVIGFAVSCRCLSTVLVKLEKCQTNYLNKVGNSRNKIRLFECIRAEMKKGSPEGYDAETGLEEPAQTAQTGEPNERYSLYRIRCPQEKYQSLREVGRWADCGRRPAAGQAGNADPVGEAAAGAVVRGHGGDAIQRLDLRHVEAVCGGTADGASGDDESHSGIEEEERPARRAQDRRPGAMPTSTGALRTES